MKNARMAGATLVELLLAMMILIIASTFVAHHYQTLRKNLEALRIQSDLESLQDYLSRVVSCVHTLQPYRTLNGNIVCAGPIPLKDQNKIVLPLSTPQWALSVSCSNTQLEVKVQVLDKAGRIKVDPRYAGETLDFNNQRINPLFGKKGGVSLCAAQFRPTTKAKVENTTLASIGFRAADCASVNSTPAIPPNGLANIQGWANYTMPFRLMYRMQSGCSNFCVAAPRRAKGGFLVNCSGSNAQCACFK